MRIGSLFSGAGGLDLAVGQVLGATTAWHCELDPAASKVLAHRWPGVPNLGDITKVNWSNWKPLLEVDILCGGYPCQPFSAAGQRKGANDERHLWPYFAQAIRHLQPRYVVLENVAGHRSMGFDSVLADLAGIGYDAQWCSLRASDVGAPHRRERLFVVAHPDNATRDREWSRPQSRQGSAATSHPAQPERRGPQQQHLGASTLAAAEPRERFSPSAIGCHTHAHSPGDGRHEGRPEPARLVGGSDAAVGGAGPVDLLPTPRSSRGASTTETSYALGGVRSDDDRTQGEVLLPTPRSTDCFGPGLHGDGGMDLRTTVTLLQTPSTADGDGGHLNRSGSRKGEPLLPGQAREMAISWGKYEPAIHRWETLTRPAPAPTEPNTKGNPRLAAAFSEWMLGWPAGWVTAVPGISRNDALRIVGNGVVPQQAAAALRWLLTVSEQAA